MPRLCAPLSVARLREVLAVGRQVEVRDGACPGLAFRVERSGRAYWIRHRGRWRIRLGMYPAMTLAMARHAATRPDAPPPTPKRVLLSQLVTRYTQYLRATRDKCRSQANLAPVVLGKLLEMPIDKLTPALLDDWLAKRLQVVSKATARRNLTQLKAALKQAVTWGLISRYPLADYSPVKRFDVRRTRVLTDAERIAVTEAAKSAAAPFGALILLCLWAGLRSGEARALQWQHVDLDSGLLHILTAKGGEQRSVPMHAYVRAALERIGPLAEGRVLLDMESPGERLRGFWRGLDFRNVDLYTLRHDFATEVLRRGYDINVVRELLGHKDIKTTARYLTATGSRLRSAVESLGRHTHTARSHLIG